MKKRDDPLARNRWLLAVALTGLIAGSTLIFFFTRISSDIAISDHVAVDPAREIQMQAIRHYATSKKVPQQSLQEISVSFDVLRTHSPCNFLVFGLGLDSLMWASLNPTGTTLFLEEDPKWIQIVLKDSPALRARVVRYRTKLSQADTLLSEYRSDPGCWPGRAQIGNRTECRLALTGLSEEVYDTQWDLVMIDAPRGYFADAPGRMSAIYTAAVMARRRKRPGDTHVFLHDVNRRVEKEYAEQFLCRKFLVKAVGRLWHFRIPPASNINGAAFC